MRRVAKTYFNLVKAEYAQRHHATTHGYRAKRSRELKHKYGITLADKERILAAQGDCCACCGDPLDQSVRKGCVDHDHESGTIRGILCDSCNRGIGYFQNDPEILRSALRYLEKGSNIIMFPLHVLSEVS